MKKRKFSDIVKRRKVHKLLFSCILLVIITGYSACKKDERHTPTLLVSPTTLEFEAAGGTEEISIATNVVFTISDSSDWCSASFASAEEYSTVLVTVQENTDSTSRSTVIFIDSEELSREVLVNQKGVEDTVPVFVYDIPPDDTDMRDISSIDLAQKMGVGWNVGNSLDAIDGETSWGNPLVSQRLIDSVKAAGFNSVRIPVAWSRFSDESSFIIDTDWLVRVEEVVNYVLGNDMYAIINIHWDGGWIQPTYEDEVYVTNRLSVMWKQIATHFMDYDDHLLFAGTNEVMVENDYSAPKVEYYTVQNGYNQTFVTTVRATGGRNAYRHLVVQGFNTNIDYTVSFAVMPTDVTEDRLMMEVHYYDPYNFTINENSSITQWGEIATEPSSTETWANESYADGQFQKMKTNFIDDGIPVILGEYGVISRTDVTDHETYRVYYIEYITQSLVDHGLVPFYWDNGYTGNHGLGIFDRSTGEQVYPDIVEAITGAIDD
ncbi:MAG: cellulase family glycosylhydrolase [Bacteroidales bacterium]|jgi:endoglucanase